MIFWDHDDLEPTTVGLLLGEDRRSYHVARVYMAAGRRGEMHTHDFAEVFFVEHGRALHPR